jgi:hypothetical protein
MMSPLLPSVHDNRGAEAIAASEVERMELATRAEPGDEHGAREDRPRSVDEYARRRCGLAPNLWNPRVAAPSVLTLCSSALVTRHICRRIAG